MITADQKKQLLEAGYTIGKSGNTVLSKSGGSVGGYNKNGGLWSGSAKVKAILKSEPKEAPKKAAKEAPKKTPKKTATEKPVSTNAMTGYGAGDVVTTRLGSMGGGRGDGRAERVRRSADAALDRVLMKDTQKVETPTRSNKPFSGTKPTKEELGNMSILQKLRWGLLFQGGGDKKTSGAGTTQGRKARRDSQRYAQGGMVKANCGASMKPTQSRKK